MVALWKKARCNRSAAGINDMNGIGVVATAEKRIQTSNTECQHKNPCRLQASRHIMPAARLMSAGNSGCSSISTVATITSDSGRQSGGSSSGIGSSVCRAKPLTTTARCGRPNNEY